MSYEEPQSGEWVHPAMQGYKMACCDCGLVHRLDFRVLGPVTKDNGDGTVERDELGDHCVEYRAFRDNRATAQIRRHANKT
jgi:hypothetical protein